ncbi:hypothetical protein CYMTET_17193 [Cymbomonas tetramitiformis]|uniref:Uncharacterized protein n=1 Tax=Cymbomonas tetramitiformis TaxID=36881 RepID=A0AAE0GAU0_9CHLO|nr:hypothetical protein CYMTET_17193 [Cymbomonas tetramitiformis]
MPPPCLRLGLKHAGDDAHADPPPERRFGDRQRGGGGVRFPPSKWRDERNRQPNGKFHGRNRELQHRFAASPLTQGGNWGQSHGRQAARCVSFNTLSFASVQECPVCPGHYHATARCPAECGDCDEELRNAAIEMDDAVSAFYSDGFRR